jgi:hypothetical protein
MLSIHKAVKLNLRPLRLSFQINVNVESAKWCRIWMMKLKSFCSINAQNDNLNNLSISIQNRTSNIWTLAFMQAGKSESEALLLLFNKIELISVLGATKPFIRCPALKDYCNDALKER